MRRRIGLAGLLVCGPLESRPPKPSSLTLLTVDQAKLCSPLGMVSKSLVALEFGNKAMQSAEASVLRKAVRTGADGGVMRTTAHVNLYTMVLKMYRCDGQPARLQTAN